jgi:AcrR family transcriptional regulator
VAAALDTGKGRSGRVSGGTATARRRVPAAQRREELIAAAIAEFARGGLNGTAVERIANRVGVAQPYVFSLFESKRELFLAALERSFERVAETFREAAAAFESGRAPDCENTLVAMGRAYRGLLRSNRDYLMLHHHAYAACAEDEAVRALVRNRFAQLAELVRALSRAGDEAVDDFFRHGMALNVAAALGVEDLSVTASWVGRELRRSRG